MAVIMMSSLAVYDVMAGSLSPMWCEDCGDVLWSQGWLWLPVLPPPPPPVAGTSRASLYLPAAPQDLGYILTLNTTYRNTKHSNINTKHLLSLALYLTRDF